MPRDRLRLLRPRAARAVLGGVLATAACLHATPASALTAAQPLVAAVGGSARGDVPTRWRDRPAGARQRGVLELARAIHARELTARRLMRLRHEVLSARMASANADLKPGQVVPIGSADLDADRKHDVLTIERTGRTSVLRARRGRDGAELWAAPDVDYADARVRDVDLLGWGPRPAVPGSTGGGRAVVLTLGQRFSPSAPASAYELAQTVALRSAADGKPLWERTFPSRVVNQFPVFTAGDLVMTLQLVGDATGDGVRDVHVGTITLAPDAVTAAFSARLLDGVTGADAGRVDATAALWLPWVAPVGDLSGDGLTDVVAVSTLNGVYIGHTVYSARPARGGAELWSAVRAEYTAPPEPMELDGDGTPDLLVLNIECAIGCSSLQWTALRGTDGRAMWTRSQRDGWSYPAGDVDGDGSADFIEQTEHPDKGVVSMQAWSGRTARRIWGPATFAPERPAGATAAFVAMCGCPTDLTGDGVADDVLALGAFDDHGNLLDIRSRLVDGSHGGVAWTAPRSFGSYPPWPLMGDADGNGAGDLLEYEPVAEADGVRTILRVRDGATGRVVWTAERRGGDRSALFPWPVFAADTAGGSGAEVVAAIAEGSRGGSALVTEVFGAGTRYWSAP